MTKLHKIRQVVEESLDRSEEYFNQRYPRNTGTLNVDKMSWAIGLIDAYKYILEKVRQIESENFLVEDESQ